MSDYTEYYEYYKKAWEKSLSERTSELQVENARLREALEKIVNAKDTPKWGQYAYSAFIAREALRGDITPDKGGE